MPGGSHWKGGRLIFCCRLRCPLYIYIYKHIHTHITIISSIGVCVAIRVTTCSVTRSSNSRNNNNSNSFTRSMISSINDYFVDGVAVGNVPSPFFFFLSVLFFAVVAIVVVVVAADAAAAAAVVVVLVFPLRFTGWNPPGFGGHPRRPILWLMAIETDKENELWIFIDYTRPMNHSSHHLIRLGIDFELRMDLVLLPLCHNLN